MRRRVQNMIGVKLMNIMIEIFVVNLQLFCYKLLKDLLYIVLRALLLI